MQKVLISRRNPEELTETQNELLRHCFGNDVGFERTELGAEDGDAISRLTLPVVLPLWEGVKRRGSNAIVVRWPDGLLVEFVPL